METPEQIMPKALERIRHAETGALAQRGNQGHHFLVRVGGDRGVDPARIQIGILDDVVHKVGGVGALHHVEKFRKNNAFHGFGDLLMG